MKMTLINPEACSSPQRKFDQLLPKIQARKDAQKFAGIIAGFGVFDRNWKANTTVNYLLPIYLDD